MEHSIIVLSLVPSKISEEQWHFAALKVGKEFKPKYVTLLIEEGSQRAGLIEINRSKIDKMLQDSIVFVYDLAVISQLCRLLGTKYKIKELIEVREIIVVFYPLFGFMELLGIESQLGLRPEKRYSSPAHKNVRIIWEIINLCWNKGLNSDLSFLGKLEEYSQGLSCIHFIELIKKEMIKQYPDRAIRTGLNLNEHGNQLFPEETDEAEEIPNSTEWAENIFKAGGLLSRTFPGYENRAIQTVMANAIINGFTAPVNLVIEAGTGTGKSIAYLIPALWWSRKNRKRVIVATHTITLQEQLCHKDLPFLKKILPFSFKYALLKGKSNYICLKTLLYDKFQDEMSLKERLAYLALFSWVRETSTGEFAELNNLNTFSPTWKKYGADTLECQPLKCRFAGQCFMLRARRKAENADLIIINHSLLFADIKTKNNILPEYFDLIIDEAHNLYPTALKQLGFEISCEQIQKVTDNLVYGKGNLVFSLKKNIPLWAEIYTSVNWTEFHYLIEQVPSKCNEVVDQSKVLFKMLQSLLDGRSNLRISQDKLGENTCSAVMVTIENLFSRLRGLYEVLNKLGFFLSSEMEQLENYKFEIAKNKNNLAEIIEGLRLVLENNEVNRVTYLEKSHTLYLKNTAIDIADILRNKVFMKNNCTVLTSATLTVAGQFDYFTEEIGLDDYQAIKLDSPFDYDKQMLFCIVNDMPLYQSTEEILAEKSASFIKKISETMNGRTLVLFTSHRYLRLVHKHLQNGLIQSDLRILAQGIDGSRDFLLRDFMRNDKSILLGTSSFWEGVDIPGDSLSCVIMTKLPFWPPDTPIFEAKARLYQSQGRDPFRELHLPEAIIRFKQGFGRLIRSKEDRGIVILLDDRVIKKQYGQFFLKSLPILTHCRGSSEEIISLVQQSFHL